MTIALVTDFPTTPGDVEKILWEARIMVGECQLLSLAPPTFPGKSMEQFIAFKKAQVSPQHTILHGLYTHSTLTGAVQRLKSEIALIAPKVILTMGEWAMWTLTGHRNALKQRGSLFRYGNTPLIVTLAPERLQYLLEYRAMVVSDLRRVRKLQDQIGPVKFPGDGWRFTIRPSFGKVMAVLVSLIKQLDSGVPLWIDFDLETKAGHIACAGISWTKTDALCIPFMCEANTTGYWSLEEESAIVFTLYRLLTHRNVNVRGQNLLYDCQYTYRHWHFLPRVKQDTMISHHTCFAGLPKKLDFQASLYCESYQQWKPEKVSWKEGG